MLWRNRLGMLNLRVGDSVKLDMFPLRSRNTIGGRILSTTAGKHSQESLLGSPASTNDCALGAVEDGDEDSQCDPPGETNDEAEAKDGEEEILGMIVEFIAEALLGASRVWVLDDRLVRW